MDRKNYIPHLKKEIILENLCILVFNDGQKFITVMRMVV